MKLPNSERAIVDLPKLRDYSLNPEHPIGQHKARVFAAALGLTVNDSEELQSTLLTAVQKAEVVNIETNEFGVKYVVDFVMQREEKQANVRSVWIIRSDEDIPRLTTCYVRRGTR